MISIPVWLFVLFLVASVLVASAAVVYAIIMWNGSVARRASGGE